MWKLFNVDNFRQKLSFQLASQCCCRNGMDSDNHIFLSCSFAQDLWRVVAIYIGFPNIPWGSFQSLKDCVRLCWLYGQDKILFMNKHFPILIYWCLWLVRCKFFFHGIFSPVGATLHVFSKLLHELGLAKDFHSLQRTCNLPHIHYRFHTVLWIDYCPPNSFILSIGFKG